MIVAGAGAPLAQRRPPNGWFEAPDAPTNETEASVLQLMLRRKWSIAAFTVVATILAAVVVSRMSPLYTASASLTIEARQVRLINAEQLLSSQLLDAESLRTEMASFTSPRMARAVVEKLGLDSVPEFCGAKQPPGTWRDKFLQFAGLEPAPPPEPCTASVDDVAKRVMHAINIGNDGRSYIIDVSAEAGTPVLAASIANAYAEAFVEQRRTERAEVADKARAWLNSYVDELREKVMSAEADVADYRGRYHLIPVHGETLASQSLVELNTRLNDTMTELAQKEGASSQLRALLTTDKDYSSAAATLSSPLLQELLVKEADAANTKTQLQTQFGDRHPGVVAANARLAELRQQIRVEANKAVAGLDRDVAALNARKTSLVGSMKEQQSRIGEQADDDVRLRELERDADSNRQIYQNSLTRLHEIEAEAGMQQSDARFIAEAQPPDTPSYPRSAMMVVGAMLAAIGIGSGAAIVAGLLSRNFRDKAHIEQGTGINVIGLFPRPQRRTAPQNIAVDSPQSIEAEALHRILVNFTDLRVENGRPAGLAVLLTSALPGEGKTSFGLAIGRAAALAGFSTVLVDCDLRRPAAASLLNVKARPTEDVEPSQNGLYVTPTVDDRSGLTVLSLGRDGVTVPHRLLGSPDMRELIEKLRGEHDLILLDTPPLLAVADAMALAPLADEVVLLVDQQRTPREAVEAAIAMVMRAGCGICGFVLSKVDLRQYALSYRDYSYAASRSARLAASTTVARVR